MDENGNKFWMRLFTSTKTLKFEKHPISPNLFELSIEFGDLRLT